MTSRPNTGSNIEVTILQTFNRETGKILGFLMVCRLYIRIKIRDISVKEQVQQVLLYMQEVSVNIWKKNIMKDLESENLSYTTVGEFLANLKSEFGEGDDEMMKVAKLKKLKQESKTIEEFV